MIDSNCNFYGSFWSKWDLHVHTPNSIVHEYKNKDVDDVWEEYIKNLENLKDVKVLGINDYWFIDGYKKVLEYKQQGRLQNIELILPVVELRLKCFVGNSKLNKINYHIIFSNELNPDEIEEEFIKKIEIKNLDNKSLTKTNLIEYGNKIINENDKKGASPLIEGFNNFVVNLELIKELLSKKLFENKYLLAIGRNEWNDFRWDGSADVKKSLINEVHFVFSASPNIEQFRQNKDKLHKNKVNDLLIHCSDAHQFPKDENNTRSKEIGHCYTWIKAKPTFEGLRQVIFEPKYRLIINNEKPLEPIYYIKSIELNFRKNIEFKNSNFCFSDVKEKICFSPYLTCIIGGRGSGKSTLLNLIAKKLNILNNDFFEDLNISDDEFLSSIRIEPDSLINTEYLPQNEIEKFATDSKEFSNSIFNRLNKLSNFRLSELENDISLNLKIFNKHIKNLKERHNKHQKLNELKKELKNYKDIIKVFTDKEYLNLKNKLQKMQKKYIQNLNSLRKLTSLQEVLYYVLTDDSFDVLNNQYYGIIKKNDDILKFEKDFFDGLLPIIEKKDLHLIEEPKNEFDKIYNKLLIEIHKIYSNIFNDEDYIKEIKALKSLKEKIKELNEKINLYLKEKGMTNESIFDINRATENIEKLKEEIKNIKRDILILKAQINKFSYEEIDKKIEEFKKEINNQLINANSRLKKIANEHQENIKIIEIKFDENNDIFEKIFNEFEKELNLYDEIRSYRETFKNYLKEISVDEFINLKDNKELIKLIEKNHKNTQTYKKIKKVFISKTNFLIFKTLVLKYKRDIKNNKNFCIYYDNKDIKNSSFGQKCTAVIVIMLLLGNNPIIIDEPEAHLDSSLIADYLVSLIKEVKQYRQIIFATHNANFVLNGDAELIIKLENIDGKTSFKFFAIEDLEYREELLKLEGGKEAFKLRENKYGI